MGLLGVLNFVLKFFDVLAWPFFALGYPLCASIRAIETNSHSEAHKLVTYWILFSLISLFEHALGKLLEWLLVWPHIKLMIICWLVIPQFDGSLFVYNRLVRPCLSMNPQVLISKFNKWKEFLLKRDNFLAEAERYINENGHESLEKLIASKLKSKNLNLNVEEVEAIAATEKKEVEWSSVKESKIVQKDIKSVKETEKKEVSAPKQVNQPEPNLTQTENITLATTEIKRTAGEEAELGYLPEIPAAVKVKKEWTCDICQVTTEHEKTFNSHLQGKKHKAKYEALKAKNQPNINLTAKKTDQIIEEPEKIASTNKAIQKIIINHEGKQGQQNSVSALTANKPAQPIEEEPEKSNGKEPKIVQKDIKAVKETEKKEVPAPKQVIGPESNLSQTENIKLATTEIKRTAVEVAASRDLPEIPAAVKVKKKWTCDVCQVTTEHEKPFNLHLQGKKHKANYEALKANNQTNIDPTAKKTDQQKDPRKEVSGMQDSNLRCYLCNVRCTGEGDLVSHFNGRKHLARLNSQV